MKATEGQVLLEHAGSACGRQQRHHFTNSYQRIGWAMSLAVALCAFGAPIIGGAAHAEQSEGVIEPSAAREGDAAQSTTVPPSDVLAPKFRPADISEVVDSGAAFEKVAGASEASGGAGAAVRKVSIDRRVEAMSASTVDRTGSSGAPHAQVETPRVRSIYGDIEQGAMATPEEVASLERAAAGSRGYHSTAQDEAACGDALIELASRSTIYFDAESAELTDEARSIVDELTRASSGCGVLIVVRGLADSSGRDVDNMRISWLRATNTLVAISEAGGDVSTFRAVGLGTPEAEVALQAAEESGETTAAALRRVEFFVPTIEGRPVRLTAAVAQ